MPPLVAAGLLLAEAGFRVAALASSATRTAVRHAGFEVAEYQRAPSPETRVPFESVASEMLAVAAGLEVALDTREVLQDLEPTVAVVDCMLPAALSACATTGTRCVSLVHFAYGPARAQILDGAGAWTTDRDRLDFTHRALGLPPTEGDLAVWETPELLLVTAPAWFDAPSAFPANVVHAGPLGVKLPARPAPKPCPPRLLLAFSTTVIEGQAQVVQAVCDAIAPLPVEALVTLGSALEPEELRLPSNVTAVRRIDHDQVLASTSAVVSHGGLGTTLRSLAHGVPMVLVPLARDQRFNAHRVATLGVGVQLDRRASSVELASAIETVLCEQRFSVAAQSAAGRLRAEQPDRVALEALLRAACLPSR